MRGYFICMLAKCSPRQDHYPSSVNISTNWEYQQIRKEGNINE